MVIHYFLSEIDWCLSYQESHLSPRTLPQIQLLLVTRLSLFFSLLGLFPSE